MPQVNRRREPAGPDGAGERKDSMANKMQYVTHQRKDMLDYFQSVGGKHVTAADICECFRQSGKKIGMTT